MPPRPVEIAWRSRFSVTTSMYPAAEHRTPSTVSCNLSFRTRRLDTEKFAQSGARAHNSQSNFLAALSIVSLKVVDYVEKLSSLPLGTRTARQGQSTHTRMLSIARYSPKAMGQREPPPVP